MFIKTVVAVIACTPLFAQASCDSLDELTWMLGDWSDKSSQRDYQEHWHRVSENTFEGHSKVIDADGKPVGFESLRLMKMTDGIFYLAKVPENKLPTAFALVDCAAASATFSNPQHDFPKSLHYAVDEKGKLKVTVLGAEDEGFTLNFERQVAE